MKYLPLLSAVTLAGAALVVPANASSVDLHVAGSISPGGSCSVKIGDSVIELGRISRNELHATEPTPLEPKALAMDINCGSPSRYALTASSANGSLDNFGLVSDADQSATGTLQFLFHDHAARMDGKPGYVSFADDGSNLVSAAWGPSTHTAWPIRNGSLVYGFVPTDGSRDVPAFIKDLHANLDLNLAINPLDELDLHDDIAFSSVVSFEIRYF